MAGNSLKKGQRGFSMDSIWEGAVGEPGRDDWGKYIHINIAERDAGRPEAISNAI
jgi:hypothetical protein